MSVYSETPTDEGEKMLNSIANRRRRTRLGQRAHTTKQPDTCSWLSSFTSTDKSVVILATKLLLLRCYRPGGIQTELQTDY